MKQEELTTVAEAVRIDIDTKTNQVFIVFEVKGESNKALIKSMWHSNKLKLLLVKE